MGFSREFLKGLELDKSTIDAIMSEYGSSVTELKEQILTLKEENSSMKNASEELATLQKSNKELEKQLSDLTSQKQELETNSAQNLKDLKREYAIKSAITKSAPIDEVSYRAHLDDSKIEYDEEKDELIGFDEQDKAIKEKYAFLFSQGATGDEHSRIDSNNNSQPLSIADAVNQSM